jgi:plastocyanin
VVIGGKSVAVPTDQGKAISQVIDEGQQIIISASGFLPAKLYASPSEAIVWTNLTNQPQQVVFDHFSVKSPVIAPGATWKWTTVSSESITYHSISGMHALVIVNPPGI